MEEKEKEKMNIVDQFLQPGEYYKELTKKDTIYLHHTAGGHRPDWTILGWENDKNKVGLQLPVATAYVIGGISTRDKDDKFDGVIYRAFDEKYWAHHLGIKQPNNKLLNQKSIAIEICNYGPATKASNGKFLSYVKNEIPSDMVVELAKSFKKHTHWHKYTEKQLISLRALLIDLSDRHNINLKQGLQAAIAKIGVNAFELNTLALLGAPGLWNHTNVIAGKSDCYPDPNLIQLINSL